MAAGLVEVVSRLVRIPGVRGAWQRFPKGPLDLRARHDIWPRPHYGFGVWEAARLARALEVPRITVVEFGVAQGAGLLAMEAIAAEVETHLGVAIDVVGFDTGQGLPPPADYRDLPHFWSGGFYRMNEAALRAKLRRARLILGDVSDTVPPFLAQCAASPLAFVSFDLDYYTSTAVALRIFDGPSETHLPRVLSYFDDVIFPFEALLNEHVGEELAIREFNARHAGGTSDVRQVTAVRGLSFVKNYRTFWHEQMYCFHHFSHPQYTVSVHPRVVQQRLAARRPGPS